jgi:hypothetical protein
MASVWAALKHGVDFNPPLFYGLIRFSESMFGEGHLGTRLPAILGFWIFCLCLFRFVSTRTSVLAGLISMLFPLVSTAYFYAYEVRSYGVVLGFGGIALVCWQAANRSGRRGFWLVGLFVAFLCAILTHPYAIFLTVPIVLAEFVRSVSLKRVDWPVWIATVSSWSGALISIYQFLAYKAMFPLSFGRAGWTVLANSYQFHLAPAVGVLSAGLVLYFVFQFVLPNSLRAPNREKSLELSEVVALLAFVAMPFIPFVVARLTSVSFAYRYGISTVAGFACLFGVVTAKRPPVGLAVLLVLIAQIGINLHGYAKGIKISEPRT